MRPRASNDVTGRAGRWRRYDGDVWACYDALPVAVRRRLAEHAYDAWSVNAAMLWRRFRLKYADGVRAERALLRYLDQCEVLERESFAIDYLRGHGTPLPHVTSGVTVLRYQRRPPARANPL